jgi:hypothetical protein
MVGSAVYADPTQASRVIRVRGVVGPLIFSGFYVVPRRRAAA